MTFFSFFDKIAGKEMPKNRKRKRKSIRHIGRVQNIPSNAQSEFSKLANIERMKKPPKAMIQSYLEFTCATAIHYI